MRAALSLRMTRPLRWAVASGLVIQLDRSGVILGTVEAKCRLSRCRASGVRCRAGPSYRLVKESLVRLAICVLCRALRAMRGAARRVGVLSLDARQECVQELLLGAFAGGYC